MSDIIKLVQGDQRPYIKMSLTDANGNALNVASATVVVKFRAANTTTLLATIPCTNFTNGTDGIVVFNFPGTTLSVPPGQYEGEVEINFAGEYQTVYDVLNFVVRQQF
jgi:hypothetical protein